MFEHVLMTRDRLLNGNVMRSHAVWRREVMRTPNPRTLDFAEGVKIPSAQKFTPGHANTGGCVCDGF